MMPYLTASLRVSVVPVLVRLATAVEPSVRLCYGDWQRLHWLHLNIEAWRIVMAVAASSPPHRDACRGGQVQQEHGTLGQQAQRMPEELVEHMRELPECRWRELRRRMWAPLGRHREGVRGRVAGGGKVRQHQGKLMDGYLVGRLWLVFGSQLDHRWGAWGVTVGVVVRFIMVGFRWMWVGLVLVWWHLVGIKNWVEWKIRWKVIKVWKSWGKWKVGIEANLRPPWKEDPVKRGNGKYDLHHCTLSKVRLPIVWIHQKKDKQTKIFVIQTNNNRSHMTPDFLCYLPNKQTRKFVLATNLFTSVCIRPTKKWDKKLTNKKEDLHLADNHCWCPPIAQRDQRPTWRSSWCWLSWWGRWTSTQW